MPTLPFHRYIGPGNQTDNGEPVDCDDHIARDHDVQYDAAKTAEDVVRADLEAIARFRADWKRGNWHSLIGDVGLSLKVSVERFTGVLYPRLPSDGTSASSSSSSPSTPVLAATYTRSYFNQSHFLTEEGWDEFSVFYH